MCCKNAHIYPRGPQPWWAAGCAVRKVEISLLGPEVVQLFAAQPHRRVNHALITQRRCAVCDSGTRHRVQGLTLRSHSAQRRVLADQDRGRTVYGETRRDPCPERPDQPGTSVVICFPRHGSLLHTALAIRRRSQGGRGALGTVASALPGGPAGRFSGRLRHRRHSGRWPC